MMVPIIARLTAVGDRLLGLGRGLSRSPAAAASGAAERMGGWTADPVARWAERLEQVLGRMDAASAVAPPRRGASLPRSAGMPEPAWPDAPRAFAELLGAEPAVRSGGGEEDGPVPRGEAVSGVAGLPISPAGVTRVVRGREAPGGERTSAPSSPVDLVPPATGPKGRGAPVVVAPQPVSRARGRADLPRGSVSPVGSMGLAARERMGDPGRLESPPGRPESGVLPLVGDVEVAASGTVERDDVVVAGPVPWPDAGGGTARPGPTLRLSPGLGRIATLLGADLVRGEAPVAPEAPAPEGPPMALVSTPEPLASPAVVVEPPSPSQRVEVSRVEEPVTPGPIEVERLVDALADHLEQELLRVYGPSGR